MRRVVTLAASVIAAAVVAAPAAEAKQSKHMCELAWPIRTAIIKKHGARAPGRNICRDGVTTRRPLPRRTCEHNAKVRRGPVRRPTNHEKACYLRALRRLNNPPPMLTRAGPPPQAPAGTSSPRAGGVLEAIAQCESGGDPTTDTGNGFYGKYQFTWDTWMSVGGTGNPAHASEAEQDMRAAILYSRSGGQPWPVCAAGR